MLLGLALIPFLDRETDGHRRVVRRPRRAARSSLRSTVVRPRRRARDRGVRDPLRLDPRVVAGGAAAPHHVREPGDDPRRGRTRSGRSGASAATTRRAPARSALFTCFLCGFLVLTVVGRPLPRAQLGLLLVAGRRGRGTEGGRVRANKLLLLLASLATLALLATAAYRETVARDWRRLQRAYRARLDPRRRPTSRSSSGRSYVPALGATDRCISCHVGMAPGETGVAGDPVFGRHPDVVHDPADYGCIVCHGGQGRATEKADAHGDVAVLAAPDAAAAVRVRRLRELPHAPRRAATGRARARARAWSSATTASPATRSTGAAGRSAPAPSRVAAPDLSRVGAAGYDPDWYARHLAQHDAAATAGSGGARSAPIADADRAAHRRRCSPRASARRGSSRRRPSSTASAAAAATRSAASAATTAPTSRAPASGIPGSRTSATSAASTRSPTGSPSTSARPATVVPGSQMPQLGLTEAQIDALTFYMLSLRRSDAARGLLAEGPDPRRAVRRARVRDRRRDALRHVLRRVPRPARRGHALSRRGGVPGDRQPRLPRRRLGPLPHGDRAPRAAGPAHAGVGREGGLRPAEIDAVVAHVRTLAGDVPPPAEDEPRRWVAGRRRRGRAALRRRVRVVPRRARRGEGRAGARATRASSPPRPTAT